MRTIGSGEGKRVAKGERAAKNKPVEAGGTGAIPFGAPKMLSSGEIKMSLVQRVYESIMEAVDRDELRPGSRVIAAEIAQRLGLSRAPVREALAVLAGQGLVELLPDRGARLRPMTDRDLAGIYEVVGPVAALGIRGAAMKIGEGDNAARVAAALAAIEAAAKDPAPGFSFYLVLNEFHYLVNAIAGKPYVDFVLRAVNLEYWNRLLAKAIDLRLHAEGYARNYKRMADAVLAGDPDSAEAVMRYHADWCVSLLSPTSNEPNRRRSPIM